MPLSIKTIDAAKPRDKSYKLADAQGLYLAVLPSGAKSWRSNYKKAGKQATRTYGMYPAVGLAQARKAHVLAKDAPESPTNTTFEAIAKQWLRVKLPTLSNVKHQGQMVETLERYVYPALAGKPINAITRTELVAVVRAVDEQGKTETAHRVAGRIGMVFDYAQDTGVIEHHAASGLSRVLSRRKLIPMASIPPTEAAELIHAVKNYPEPITRLGLLLLLYTFVRVGELRGMRWSEIIEPGIWVIPAERMKGRKDKRKPHVVPLSMQAQAVLEQLQSLTGHRDLVLESPLAREKPLSENTFLFALYRMGYRGRMTAHGFRALASTVLNEQSGFAGEVIERQLAHKETDEVRAAYNRAQYLPQRIELMKWWADWTDQQTLPKP